MTLPFVTLHILVFDCWNFHVDVFGTSQLYRSTDSRLDKETSLFVTSGVNSATVQQCNSATVQQLLRVLHRPRAK